MNLKNNSFAVLLFLFINVSSAFAQEQSPRLIVRADDMGFAHSANEAIMKSMLEGVATSVEVLVPAPWFPEVVKMLQAHPELDVGVHLTLTSEWSNMKFRPVSSCPSLTNEDGYFYPFIWPSQNASGGALQEQDWKLEEIEQEFRAQIELALKKLPQTSHISAHMGCYDMSPEVQALAKKLAKEYEIDIEPADYGVERARYAGPKETAAQKVESFIKMLEGLEAGNTYLFVDHPGFDNAELRAIHHPGYEGVAIDRQGVTDAWTHPRVKEAIERLGIQLISYQDLVE